MFTNLKLRPYRWLVVLLVALAVTSFSAVSAQNDDEQSGFAERCRAAGYTTRQCRRIWNANNGQGDLAERCRAAGLTPEECRRIVGSDEESDFARRCLAAGYTTQECRRIWNANNGQGNLAERCRAAGLTTEECRHLWNAAHDNSGDTGITTEPPIVRDNHPAEAPSPVETRPADAEPVATPARRG